MAEFEAKLYYFDGRGLAERIRLMLCITGVKFEEVFFTERSELEKLLKAGDLLFGQLPLLEIDGLKLVQSNAVTRYVASRSNMYSTDPKDQVRIDSLYDGTRDFMTVFMAPIFRMSEEEMKKQAEEAFPKYLPVFEKVLKENGTGYLVGKSVTLADAGLLEVLLAMEDYFDAPLKDYPQLNKFLSKMKSLDGVKVYLKKYRKRKNDEKLKTEVMRVLGKS